MSVWYAPKQNIMGLVIGDFIYFYWNNRLEESYFRILEIEKVWVYIGEFE